MGKKRHNGPAQGARPTAQQVQQIAGAQLAHTLSILFPSLPEEARRKIAMGVVQNSLEIARAFLGNLTTSPETHWEVEISEPSPIALDGKGETIRIVAPKDISKCNDIHEAFRSAAILAVLTSDIARAALAAQGFQLSVGHGTPKIVTGVGQDAPSDDEQPS